jgi:hypothetical protein
MKGWMIWDREEKSYDFEDPFLLGVLGLGGKIGWPSLLELET